MSKPKLRPGLFSVQMKSENKSGTLCNVSKYMNTKSCLGKMDILLNFIFHPLRYHRESKLEIKPHSFPFRVCTDSVSN